MDVIIIGGGPAGTAAAWALGRLQPGIRTLIIERAGGLGAGSSRASLENYRTCWPTRCLAAMMRRSVDILMHADDSFGDGAQAAIHLKQRGYLWCGFTDGHAAALKADVAHLHDMGLPHMEYLDADEVQHRFPWLGRRVIAAKYDPTAGWLDSNALIHRYVQAAAGVQVLLDAPDAALRIEGGRVVGVVVAGEFVAAPRVILAAGAWAPQIARTAGVTVPVVVRPRQSFTTGWRHEAFPADAPMLIGSAPFPHVRPEARTGAIFGWEYRWHRRHARALASDTDVATVADDALALAVDPVESLKDPRFPSITLALMARQFGHAQGEGFNDPRYLRSLYHNAGYYVYRSADAAYRLNPDGSREPYESERAILDAHPDVPGLYLSVAHSGHGIMSSPAAGEIIARKVLDIPQPDPLFEEFALGVHWVDHDENAL
jgi:glycine/D-amino acid oxidase-like deaminating enzyme